MEDDNIKGSYVKIVLGVWIIIFASGVFFYLLKDFTNLEQQTLYPISLGLGVIVSSLIMYYMIKLHKVIFHRI